MIGRCTATDLAVRLCYPGGRVVDCELQKRSGAGSFSFAKAHYFRGCARRREEREHFLSVEAISTGCAASFPRWGVWC